MKKWMTIGVMLLFGGAFAQQDTQTLFREATNYYNDNRFDKTVENYKEILNKGLHSATLYYNLANAYYKLNQIALSIYYYNKALSLAPNDRDIKDNLFFAQAKTLDVIEPLPKTFFDKAIEVFTYFKFETWAVLAVIFSVLFNLCLVLYYVSKFAFRKRMFFSISIFAFVLMLLTLNNAYYKWNLYKNTQYAIVFSEASTVKSEPNMSSEGIFELHEGSKIQVLESLKAWRKIKLIDGKTGWMPSTDIKIL